MITPQFEWNDEKTKSNLDRHDVTFNEGATIFNDQFVATMPDPDHSQDEGPQNPLATASSLRIPMAHRTS